MNVVCPCHLTTSPFITPIAPYWRLKAFSSKYVASFTHSRIVSRLNARLNTFKRIMLIRTQGTSGEDHICTNDIQGSHYELDPGLTRRKLTTELAVIERPCKCHHVYTSWCRHRSQRVTTWAGGRLWNVDSPHTFSRKSSTSGLYYYVLYRDRVQRHRILRQFTTPFIHICKQVHKLHQVEGSEANFVTQQR